MQSLEFTACVMVETSPPLTEQKQRFHHGIAIIRLLYFLAPGPPRDYHSLLTDSNRDLFLIVELMNPINQLQRVRAIPFQREKTLIWKSESMQESHTFILTNPTPGWSKSPTTSLSSWRKHLKMGAVKPGCHQQGQRQPAEVRTHNLTLISLVLASESEPRMGRTKNPTEFNRVSASWAWLGQAERPMVWQTRCASSPQGLQPRKPHLPTKAKSSIVWHKDMLTFWKPNWAGVGGEVEH